jgi:hypothetical protein
MVTQKKLCSEERNMSIRSHERGSMMAEKHEEIRQQLKAANSSKPFPGFPVGKGEPEDTITRTDRWFW